MPGRLLATPRKALAISPLLRFIVNVVFKCADIFCFWKYPSQKAAADFEDMTLLDKIYWAYKCKKPITRSEQGSHLEEFFKSSDQVISLPGEFKKKMTITLSAAGDLYKVDSLENSKDLLYEKVADLIFEKDISYANLESQLTNQEINSITFSEKEGPPLACSRDQFAALKGHKRKKFTVMHTACNHTLDMGLEGVETTLAQLEKDDIIDVGTNRSESEQEKARIIEKKGIKIGFVSASYGLNGKEIPEGRGYLVNVIRFHQKPGPVDLSLLEKQISFCKDQVCDLIIASLHWGYEYEFFPRRDQVDMAHLIVEIGADIVIAHHPHVLQPVEYYRTRRDPNRTALIAYSLGNLTTSFSAPHIVLSGILNLSLARGFLNSQEKTYIESAEIIPVVQWEAESAGLPIIQIEKLDDLIDQAKKGKRKEEKKYIARIARYANLVLKEKRDEQ